ncbi:hypothetical protein EMIT0357P_20463 [Pseudomonas marginalis]
MADLNVNMGPRLLARRYCFVTSGKGAGGAVWLMAASIIAATEAWP